MTFKSKLFGFYAILALVYTATFLLPREIGGLPILGSSQARLLGLAILLPQLAIWFGAFYGYAKLRNYAKLIADTPDGKQVSYIATGLLILAVGLPVSAISSGILGILSQHYDDVVPLLTVVRNYIRLLPPLIGFIFIGQGAHGLGKLAKQRPRFRASHILAIMLVLISVIYCYVVFTVIDLERIYHLPPLVVALTVIAPYLYTWYIGMQAAYEVHLYGQNAPGKIYRRSWNLLASGIAVIMGSQIIYQYVTTVTIQFTSLRLVRLLLTIYVLLAAIAIGYLLAAVGAKRLQKIEEV